MGIQKDIMFLIKEALDAIEMDYDGLQMCELGNQLMRFGNIKTAKEYFESKGVVHTSIDLNGKDGAEVEDLSQPITKWDGFFDIVTNFGTSEHVENQEVCFNNIDRLCRTGGAMIHAIPLRGTYKNHSNIYYTKSSLLKLSIEKNYKTIIRKTVNRPYNKSLVCAVLVKQ
jgi:2-polyprenyl-3-methyl-5-hydroxy-6-metoxy-1,4-benzoquinol methylase